VRVNVSELAVEELRVPEYLQFKEQLVEEGYKFAPKLIMFDFFPEKFQITTKLGLVGLRKKRFRSYMIVCNLFDLYISAPTTTLFLSWTSSHSMHPSPVLLCPSPLAMVCSSSTGTCRQSSSMTRRACTPCSTSFAPTTTRGW